MRIPHENFPKDIIFLTNLQLADLLANKFHCQLSVERQKITQVRFSVNYFFFKN